MENSSCFIHNICLRHIKGGEILQEANKQITTPHFILSLLHNINPSILSLYFPRQAFQASTVTKFDLLYILHCIVDHLFSPLLLYFSYASLTTLFPTLSQLCHTPNLTSHTTQDSDSFMCCNLSACIRRTTIV